MGMDLAGIETLVKTKGINPQPRSGRQERLENLVNRYL
jgi:xylose isomerase